MVAKQVQIEGMRSFAAEDNPELILAKKQLAALQRQLDSLRDRRTTRVRIIVHSKGNATHAGLEYLRRFRDLKYYEAIYELWSKG